MYMQLIDSGAMANAVDFSLLKQHTRIDTMYDDNLVLFYLQSATDLAEKYTGRNFISRSMTFDFAATTPPATTNFLTVPVVVFPLSAQYVVSIDQRTIELPRSPVTAISNVSVTSWGDAPTTLVQGTDWDVDLNSDPQRIKFYTYNTRDQNKTFSVTFTAGYGSTDATVPFGIRSALMLMVTRFYEHRGDDVEIDGLTPAARSLLWPYRNISLGY